MNKMGALFSLERAMVFNEATHKRTNRSSTEDHLFRLYTSVPSGTILGVTPIDEEP